MTTIMDDREHLRSAIITLRRKALRANTKARELEATYLAKYGRGAHRALQAEISRTIYRPALERGLTRRSKP